MFKAIITMMDVPTAMGLLAPRVRQLSRGGALLIFSCLLLILGPLAYLWWRYDLSSTWFWFADLIGDGSAAKAEVGAAATKAGADDATAGLILLLFGLGFTLLPSAVQIGLTRFISVPALGFLVKVSLGFDLITDWPALWQIAARNPWYDSAFGWWPLAGLARLLATALGTVIVSVVIQS
ncbi:hypothetical protein K2Z83_22755, partial [Oscillochloris sp. ZM17-4]|uniref:hypothetical protein n=1 Tax=Oscillochloris sp. ZM17-4 TaxID=2866714 RepID=UPI001C738C23